MRTIFDNQPNFPGFDEHPNFSGRNAGCPCDVGNYRELHTIRDEGITAEKLGVESAEITCDRITKERINEIIKLMWQRSAGMPPTPKIIRRRGTATIVEWQDGTQTKVIREQGHPDWGIFGAFCVALAKKVYGNKSRLEKAIKMADEERQLEEKRRAEAERREAAGKREANALYRKRRRQRDKALEKRVMEKRVENEAEKIYQAVWAKLE